MSRLLYIILIWVSQSAPAQDKEPVSIQYGFSKLHYNDTAAQARLLDTKCRIPVYQKNNNTFLATIGYKNVDLIHFPEAYTNHLHGFTLQAAWLHKLSARKSLLVMAQAGLFSDLNDISSKSYRYSAALHYRVKHSEKLSTGWGLVYSRQFFGNQLIPFIDVNYKPGSAWSITGQFPVKPKILYHFNKQLSAGLEVNGEAASYRLSATQKNNQFIQINQWAGLARLEYRFAKAWQLHAGIGKNFKQSYRLYNDASTTSWTIITIPIGHKPEPVQKIDSKGLHATVGIAIRVFDK